MTMELQVSFIKKALEDLQGQMIRLGAVIEISGKSVKGAVDGLDSQIKLLGPEMNKAADLVAQETKQLSAMISKGASSQSRQQWAVLLLTAVITCSTLAYSWTTWSK